MVSIKIAFLLYGFECTYHLLGSKLLPSNTSEIIIVFELMMYCH